MSYWLRVAAFCLGLLLTAAGWTLDHAGELKLVQRWIASESFAAQDALEKLAASEPLTVLPISEHGVAELVERWPRRPRDSIFGVSRNIAVLEFGPEVQSEVQLRLMLNELKYAGDFTWQLSAARTALAAELNGSLLRWGGWLVVVGLIITALSGGYEFWSEQGTEGTDG